MKIKILPLIVLAALAAISSRGQRIVEVSNLTALQSRQFLSNETVRVKGYSTAGDWGEPRDYFWRTNDATVTNAVMFPAVGGGSYWHPWNGDVRTFGVKFGSTTSSNDAAANDLAFRAALTEARSSGAPIQLWSDDCYLLGNYDVSGINEIIGMGSIGPKATSILLCQKGANLFTNISTGTKIANMFIRPLHYSWVRDDVTSTAFVTQSGVSDIIIENIYLWGLWRPLDAPGIFDSKITECNFTAAAGLSLRGGGTQNHVDRVAVRGLTYVCSTNSSTVVTIPTYTAGTTNVTVSDGDPLRVGDIVMVPFANAAGYSSGLQAKAWGRRVDAVAGNVITINHPWPVGFTNSQLWFVLGQGQIGFYCESENQVSALNLEWGSWDNAILAGGPSSINFDSVHMEGLVVYAPSQNRPWIRGDYLGVNIDYLNIVNCTILDTVGLSIFDGFGAFNVENLFMRDIDMFQGTKKIFIAKERGAMRPSPVRIQYINNWGVPLDEMPFALSQIEDQGTSYRAGDFVEYTRSFGTDRMEHYGYTTTPTTGSFLSGDRVITATNVLLCSVSGTFSTPAGNMKIRSGSRVAVVDAAGRGFLSRRKVVNVGSDRLYVKRPSLLGVMSATLAADSAAGDRSVLITNIVGTPYFGEWVVLNFGGASFEEVQIQRYSSAVGRLHFSTPLTNSYTAGTTVENGVYLSGPASVTITNLTAISVSPPAFVSPIIPNTSGNWATAGSTTLGATNIGTVLTVDGGLSGARHIHFRRSGVTTNGLGVGDGSFSFFKETPAIGISQIASDASDITFFYGSSASFGVTNGRRSTLAAESAITATTNQNLVGGDLRLWAGTGSGLGAPAAVVLQVPITNSVAGQSNAQSRVSGLIVQAPPVFTATTSNTFLKIPYFNGTNIVDLRLVVTNEGGLLRALFVQ